MKSTWIESFCSKYFHNIWFSFFVAIFILSQFIIPSFHFDVAVAEEVVPQLTRRSMDDKSLFQIHSQKHGEQGARQIDQSVSHTDIKFNIFKSPEQIMEERFLKQRELQAYRGDELPLLEVFGGADVTPNQLGLYAGGVTGPLDDHINLKGLRLRAVYGRGWYEYVSSTFIGGTSVNVSYMGTSEFLEAMIGYEFRFMKTIFKVYGGLLSEKNDIDPRDPQNSLQGRKTGGKVLVEAWRDLGNGHWFSGYGSYSEGNGYYTVHGRYGYPLMEIADVGLEAGAFGNDEFDALRIGAFTRLKQGDGEWTFSAGLSGDYSDPDTAYITAQYFTKIFASNLAHLNRSY